MINYELERTLPQTSLSDEYSIEKLNPKFLANYGNIRELSSYTESKL